VRVIVTWQPTVLHDDEIKDEPCSSSAGVAKCWKSKRNRHLKNVLGVSRLVAPSDL
jgi:hypothetical protein